MPIRVLSETLVNKIAAGEVIVRPASVIKELVENSLDAGASHILIEVGNGCRDLRVRDDGVGMDRSDAELALVRHATSKITEFDDLYSLETRGFRGEALASIASVARLQLLTRKRGELAGTRVSAEGSATPLVEAAGAPEGTELRVRDLFFNTPARLKFMKSPTSELQQILATVTRQALIRPEVGFTLMNEKATLVDLPSAQKWDERVAMLLGSQIFENLLEVDAERHGVRVRGFILKPAVTRKDRRQQFFFVNSRPVSSRSLSFVVQDAYKGLVMTQRFPVVVLDIALLSGEVDVNVHPTKEEVRFRHESAISGAVHRVVRERLQAANLMPTMQMEEAGDFPEAGASPEAEASRPSAARQESSSLFAPLSPNDWQRDTQTNPVDFSLFTANLHVPSVPASKRGEGSDEEQLSRQAGDVAAADREFQALAALGAFDAASQAAPADQPPVEGQEESMGAPAASPSFPPQAGAGSSSQIVDDPVATVFRDGQIPEPLGQIAQCYILAQTGQDLLIVDQHAAHERLLYMHFAHRKREAPSQALLLPISVDVPSTAMAYMQRLLPVLDELGLHVEPFGGQTFLVQSVPADVRRFDAEGVISDLLDDYETLGRVEEVGVLRDRVVTRMACRAAIKAGQKMHLEEMRALLRDIANARLGFTCPHGRPTMILLTRDQLDRQFKRKL